MAQGARPRGGLLGFRGAGSAKAQDWTDYLHWPYVPPQNPGNGFEYKSLYDGWYLYPREQRIVPQIQGPYYRNFYGGDRRPRVSRIPTAGTTWNKKKVLPGLSLLPRRLLMSSRPGPDRCPAGHRPCTAGT